MEDTNYGMIGVQAECGGQPPTNLSHIMNTTSNTAPNNHRNGTVRERVSHAVEYYNNNVLKARVGAGLASRSSVNERYLLNGRYNLGANRLYPQNPENLYRSNSSLELLHDTNTHHNDTINLQPTLRREYGSHGSIDVISTTERPATTGESFFAMLQDYRPAVLGVIGTDQRSPGPAEYLKGKVSESTQQANHNMQNYSGDMTANDDAVDRGGSPKLRNKLHRLWGPTKPGRLSNHVSATDECSFITTLSADIEERQRRRAFAHFDCQSLTANLGYAAKLRGLLLARRRNTTTGASAASMLTARSSTPDGLENVDDYGDGQTNELLESCPFFRNEIGGEEEREVSLTRFQSNVGQKRAIHRPALAYGVSILECAPGETLWKQTTCPFQKGQRPIESVDNGARYYRQYFLGQEHQNWFGMDEQLGPVAISIKREKIPTSQQNHSNEANTKESSYQFRMIVRTSELLTLRGSVIEDSVPNPRGLGKLASTKEVLEYVAPEVQIASLRLGVNTPQCEEQILKLDEQGLTNKYKVGILYCKAGQSTEEDMYNNEDAGPAFIEFLETIGKRVRLNGFENYKAGLDNKSDSTGTHSLYATYQDCEIMFHVSTMLPFTATNRQQLLRKRHIGNDIVTIVFQEPGSLPFSPKNIRSQFQHVFICVRAVNPCTENTQYKVAVSRSKEVPVFGPPIRPHALYSKSKTFADFLLSKIINAENAAHRSEKFATMATRTRQEYLKDLATNYCTTTLVDTGPKFSIFPSKKKEKPKLRFSGDLAQRAAFCWQVVLHDTGQVTSVDCFLGISAETFVLIEECSRQIVFVTPCKSILGWSTSGYCIRIYHHQSECITLSMRESTERDEQLEVIERLRAVTNGCGAIELNLRRNPLGQLGFHVQPDGVVTQVEMSGQAWTAGLRQGYRLVEICKVAVATLSHDEMVDLLKTSSQVTVTVIESYADHSPRRGCFLQNCKFNVINYEGDYENLDENKPKQTSKNSATAQLKQPGSNHRRRYERNFSPPRSSNSSGYGTGSSSRSFSIPNEHMRFPVDMGTLTSSSSGHSSNDDRWYDILEVPDAQENCHSSDYQQHQFQSKAPVAHSNSLPLSNSVRPLSIHEPGDKHGQLNKAPAVNELRPLPRTANIEYLITKSPKIQHVTNPDAVMKTLHISDGSQADSSSINNEPVYSVSMKSVSTTDDDGIVTELVPLRRSSTTSSVHKNKSGTGTVSSSASSSRNNSPRPLTEAKLRVGVTNRNVAHLQQRNSVNYTSSTLQEDLIKLISPDYMSSDDNFHQGVLHQNKPSKSSPNSHSLGNISNLSALKPAIVTDDLLLMRKKSRSREGINLGSHGLPISSDSKLKSDSKNESDVIFTTARPATVISSSTNEQLRTANELHINEDNVKLMSPRRPAMNKRRENDNSMQQQLPPLPDAKDVDWTSLKMHMKEGLKITKVKQDMLDELNNGTRSSIDANASPPSVSSSSSSTCSSSLSGSAPRAVTPSTSLPDLQSQLTELEDRIAEETHRRKHAEQVARRLTEENRRLQDESQAAVQQLRRFTAWFFENIDR
ncbi:Signal-induced proliferation-associated 1-like protein 2 [Pseudolycoriella hygida]|uniref:Signal-induced proliferation-associated 1-like protein 2 n=1 Tax=Pseudolycoriella hygida TaxID=35572 RepID=A0A9Q0MJN1_9DIPT|nr:Signal-induced proliferation-associated 1-like protein 2 [Pseudolycoriella hygida]